MDPALETPPTLRAALRAEVPQEILRALHRRSGWMHALIALRQFAFLALSVLLILRYPDVAWIWIPCALLLGFTVLSLTILMHEVVHGVVTQQRRPRLERVLGLLYGLPSGLAPSQFTQWHLDHHDHLGSNTEDPKRAHLSPKRNARWLKALYFTPALFPLYFRAARQAQDSYPDALRRRIRIERLLTITLHVGTLLALFFGLGPAMAFKLYILPVFFVFPVAFMLNRLGQHYDIDPDDEAKWGTFMRPSPLLWDQLFVWSNYHMEHHYFPKVPCYRLPALRRALEPFLAKRGMRIRSYGGLLVDWLLRNKTPHSRWAA